MPGGLLGLLAVGAQDAYLTASPQMSYFKQVYKRPTNFSMQSVKTTFSTSPFLSPSRQTFTCAVGRVGDMLKDMVFSVVMPDIYSDDTLRFRWIKNMPNYLLYSYSATLNTQLIDQRWGEWMDVWNELSLPYDKKVAFNNLTGNVQTYMNPVVNTPTVVVKNNRLTYAYYPTATATTPSMASRQIYIPLDFWFCKNPSLALPLIGLQYQVLSITIELRSVEELYQVWDNRLGMYVSPARYNSTHPGAGVTISTFTRFGGNGPSTLPLSAYLDINYVFLDTPERTYIAGTSLDLLVERITRDDSHTGVVSAYTARLPLQNPIKELVWIFRRSDAPDYNDWANLTSAQPENADAPPLKEAKLLFNGIERFESKDSVYFNQLQTYQCHTASPRQGIYVYSCALHPEKIQPSGSFNATTVPNMTLQLTANPFATANVSPNVSTTTQYSLIVYAVQYNVFRMINGSGGMVFTL